MILIIEIALGIVLGYTIIQNHAVLLRWGKTVLALVVFLLVIGLVIWAVIAGAGAAKDYLNSILPGWGVIRDAGPALAAILAVICFIGLWCGAFAGFVKFMDEVAPLYFANAKNAPIIRNSLITLVLFGVFLVSGWFWAFPIFDGTFIGRVFQWSQTNGYEGIGVMALGAFTYQWPWPALFIIRKWRGQHMWTGE